MSFWYALVDLLPFEWAQPGHMFFMKNALLAVLGQYGHLMDCGKVITCTGIYPRQTHSCYFMILTVLDNRAEVQCIRL